MLGDIQRPSVLYLKAALFVLTGMAAAVLLFLEAPSWRGAALQAIVIWSFCRAYYFAFYVVQHYADPDFRFAGLFDFACYVLRRSRKPRSGD